jgi:hypothetical protein
MKQPVPLVVAISVAALLFISMVYLGIQLAGATREIKGLKGANAQLSAQMAANQKAVDGLVSKFKQIDATVGSQGTLQVLSKKLESGEMDLSLKSLKIVSDGRPLISLGASPEQGSFIEVKSDDGTSSAQISSISGASKIGFRTSTGPDTAQIVHIASFADDGYYIQKGPSDDASARTDGAGLRLLDPGAKFFMAQNGGGSVSIDTSSADERTKISVSAEGDPRRVINLSLGTQDVGPFVSIEGVASGFSMKLVPDRLSLETRDGAAVLAAAQDANGGFLFVNDATGARRALVTAGADGHGSISVYGNDKRSNTLFPEYNIQRSGSTQK